MNECIQCNHACAYDQCSRNNYKCTHVHTMCGLAIPSDRYARMVMSFVLRPDFKPSNVSTTSRAMCSDKCSNLPSSVPLGASPILANCRE